MLWVLIRVASIRFHGELKKMILYQQIPSSVPLDQLKQTRLIHDYHYFDQVELNSCKVFFTFPSNMKV